MNATAAGSSGTRFPWLTYPLVMSATISCYCFVLQAGMPGWLAAYLAAAAGAAAILWLEKLTPYRRDWKGTAADARVDLSYLILVQIAIPVLLAVTAGAWLSGRLDAREYAASFWPQHWPLIAQFLLVLLGADLLRYWLHRACHSSRMLWRLHAVHHSSDKLYSLNVGRFHPLEKTIQYLLDSMPFVLLGVNGGVIGLYFVFYAVNGFLQHSNVELRHGWLNYVVSSAELHRWHHSRRKHESYSNFGNNLIIWDRLFGTCYLPPEREVKTLGLAGTAYPRTFLRQMQAPFRRRSPRRSVRTLFHGALLRNCMRLLVWTRCRSLLAKTRAPDTAQAAVLRRLVQDNRNTRFGREHGFDRISDYRSFAARVPIQTYETLRPAIERQRRSGTLELTVERPVFYTRTSATTSAPKDVPYTRSALELYRRGQKLFAAFQFAAFPEAYRGRMLGIVGSAVEGRFADGTPYGAASGYFYRHIPAAVRSNYVLPWQVFDIRDYDLKYLLIARLAVADRDITHLASANPSTFLKIQSVIAKHRRQLLADVRAETFCRADELETGIRDAISPKLRCCESRKRELATILGMPAPGLGDLWPDLKLVTTWTGGSCGIALEAVRRQLPAGARIADPGYVASEFRGTITVDPASGLAVPMLDESFYEFVETEDWGNGHQRLRTISELDTGHDYYIVVTTSSGLWRYFINDIVRVNGWVNRTPSLVFVQKGRGVTNITGEKLCEAQVIDAVAASVGRAGLAAPFFVMLCRPDTADYELLLQTTRRPNARTTDRIRRWLDQELGIRNLEYRSKRDSGRLAMPSVTMMELHFADAYKKHCVARGQRESQFKPAVLQYAAGFGFDHLPFRLPVGESHEARVA